ncbi:MAG: hypothetical protein AAAFM81_00020 [Pseudomonadota bacterium]
MRYFWFCMVMLVATSTQAEPVRWFPDALGQDGRITLSPNFSPDGRFIVFAQSECLRIGDCPQRMKTSVRMGSRWSAPRLVPQTATGRADWPSITPDGRSYLFSWAVARDRHDGKDVGEDFDLYLLKIGDQNAQPVPLDSPDINRIRGGDLRALRYFNNETAPILTESGKLYFWTEREDGVGERDIYSAAPNGSGGFEVPVPLPAPINSTARDDHVWITGDDSFMLLSRMVDGESDLFFSARDASGQWSTPISLGASVNSEYADFAARITPDSRHLIFTSTRPFDDQPAGQLQVWSIPLDEVPALSGRQF